MAAPNYIFTVARVAKMLGENDALLEDIALMNMDPEDGRLTVIDLDDEVSTTAFTPFGVENLKELLADLRPKKNPRVAATRPQQHAASSHIACSGNLFFVESLRWVGWLRRLI